jgi:AbrB family looped-hinge helix DNA binding protein
MSRHAGGFGLRIVGKRGQIIIPSEIRDELGIKEGDYVILRRVGNKITIDRFNLPKVNGDN